MKNLFILTVLIPVLFFGCTKTSDSPTVLAVYTLGNGSGCTGAAVSGRYVADTAVTAANTVTITVDVTTPGPYWITTDSSNGMVFSQIGTFTATGPQTAILTATGTPLAPDTANFTIRRLSGDGGTCTFSVAAVKGTPPAYYLTCFLNGVYRNFGDSAGASNSSIPGTSGQAGLDIRGFDTVINSSEKIDFGVSTAGSAGVGIYTDTTSSASYFTYLDSLGQTWSVNSSAQPSFTVAVTIVSPSYVQGTFSGTIKNQQGTGTDSVSVTNGTFSVPVQ